MKEDLRQDDPKAERINDPSVIPHYWKWRMHICIEDLHGPEVTKEGKDFVSMLRKMVKQSGRLTYEE